MSRELLANAYANPVVADKWCGSDGISSKLDCCNFVDNDSRRCALIEPHFCSETNNHKQCQVNNS